MNEKDVREMANKLGMTIDTGVINEVLNGPIIPTAMDQDLNKIADFIEDSISPEDKKYQELPSNSGRDMSPEQLQSIEDSKKEYESKEMEATIVVDPITGISHITSIDEKADTVESVSLSDIIDGEEQPQDPVKIDEDTLKSYFEEQGLKDSDLEKMLSILTLINDDSETKVKNLYSRMPEPIQKQIMEVIPRDQNTPMARDMMANSFLDMMKTELKLDQAYIDLQKAIAVEMDIPEYLDLYTQNISDIMGIQLLEKADIIEANGAAEKAAQLRLVSKYFEYSYTMELLHREIDRRRGRLNGILNGDLKKYNKFCNHFSREYAISKFNISDIRIVAPILERKISMESGITSDDIKKFVILFCKTCERMQSSRIHEHTYMYYFINSIATLDHIDIMKTEFSKTLVSNIEKTILDMKNN